jgi:hypothetical protein
VKLEKDRECSTIHSTTGGVMTQEVGAVTGELEICTRLVAEGLEVAVRYAGAEEWYSVENSPIPLDNGTGLLTPKHIHGRVAEQLTKPGPIVDGNEQPASLLGGSS